jgi:hypothetical protein
MNLVGVAHAVPRCTFSISASTTSPGIAPATNTIAPRAARSCAAGSRALNRQR